MKTKTTSTRKKDHIDLAFKSQMKSLAKDQRFYYEPVLKGHPATPINPSSFMGKSFGYPLWISSMTGGTEKAGSINKNLARACGAYKLGMGLGSCRIILDDDTYFSDFDMRSLLQDQPFYANLGIAQVETLLKENRSQKIVELIKKLQADGLIIHINPMQEWLQPEGDFISDSPLETIKRLMDEIDYPLIVKEVGQGMGPESIKALLNLPLKAIEFAAYGGTNFAKLEMLRREGKDKNIYENVALLGHSAEEMVQFVNQVVEEDDESLMCKEVIISGGIGDYLDGYYLLNKVQLNGVYGQASALLKHATESYDNLCEYIETQMKGYQLAHQFLKVK